MEHKVLFITNIPSPYRVDFFNELGKLCNLTVLFERSESAERDSSWSKYKFTSFKGIILKGINLGVDTALAINVINYISKDNYDHIIISNPLTPTGMLAIKYSKLKNIKYSIEGDGAFPKSKKSLTELLKLHILKDAHKYFSTAEVHDEYYIKYGAKKENILRYPFSSIKEKEISKDIISKKDKDVYKRSLGMKEERIVLSIGRFVYSKGYDVLLNAAKHLDEDTGVYIVGGEITAEYRELQDKLGLKNVYFIGHKTKAELVNFYRAADIFVLPTRMDAWGLVINEAMSHGLPVITTDKCIAGLELVKNEKNGYIIPVDDINTLGKTMNSLLKNERQIKEIGRENIKKIREYTIEKMAERHIEVFKEIIKC